MLTTVTRCHAGSAGFARKVDDGQAERPVSKGKGADLSICPFRVFHGRGVFPYSGPSLSGPATQTSRRVLTKMVSVRDQHRIHGDHDAVVGDVVARDASAFHSDAAALQLDVHFFARVRLGAASTLEVIGFESTAGDHMVGQDLDQLILVLGTQQRLELRGWQLRKGFVGGREDRDRAIGREGFLQAGGLDRLGEGVEVTLLLGLPTQVCWIISFTH